MHYRINNQIVAQELRVVDETGTNIGVLKRDDALKLATEKHLDLIEIAPNATPPVARLMQFDKFRYQKEKEERKQRLATREKVMKHIRITPRAAQNDLEIKAHKAEEFLKDGHKIEIDLRLRGREKGNKAWGLQKLEGFIKLITIPHQITMGAKWGGKGFVTQIVKK